MVVSKFVRHAARATAALLLLVLSVACTETAVNSDRQMTEAKQEREKGNSKAAIIRLKDLLQKSPDHAEARYLLGSIYNDTGDYRAAEAELRRALELRYDPAKVIPPLGRSLLMMGEFQKVLDQVRLEGEAGNQPQAEILTLRAMASIGLGRRAEGRQQLDQALVKQPDFADALLGQARLAAIDKKLDDAARLIDKAIVSAPENLDAWLMKGDLARTQGDPVAATAAYRKAVQLRAENLPARLSLASLQIEAASYDEARKSLDEVRKIAPNSPLASYMLALIELRQKNNAVAREKVTQALKLAPDYMPSVLLAGAIEAALGSHAQAQVYLGRVLERAPDNLYARKLLISSLARSGQVQRAVEVLQPGLKQAPEDAALLALAGEVSMQSNDFAKAGQYFEKAAKFDPKSAGARTGLGLSRLAAGENERAMADLESAAQLDSVNYRADVILVMSHLRQRNYERALKASESLEKKQPDNPVTHNLKAAIYLGKKDTQSARKSLERALTLQPAYVPAAVNLAQLDLQDKNPQAARQRLEAIIEKDKGNIQALLALASLGPRIGATQKEGIDWLERAHRASPASVQASIMLARAYAQAGDVKKALEVVQQAQTSNPDNPEVLDALGGLQLNGGLKEQALTTYTKLVALQPDSPAALYRLAAAQAVNSNPAAAATLKKALALKPDFAEAQVALVDLELRAGRYAEAMKIANAAQKQAPKSPLGFVLEGDTMMADKKFSQAEKAYEAALRNGKNGALAIKLHAATTLAGKADQADARLVQWLKDSPDDARVRLYVADASLKGGKYKNAIEQYEALLVTQPDNVMVLNNLAWAYQQTNDSRALATAERAYKLKPDVAAIADTLGWMLVEQGDAKRGLDLLQKAVSAAPAAQEIRFHLAQAWLKAGDKAKARTELERIEANGTKFPRQSEAMNLLRQLRQ